MTVVEYLFVDRRRLDSYVEQFSSLTAYDKVPVWTFGASLAGPKISEGQQRPGRTKGDHEKIVQLLAHLRQADQLTEKRPRDYRNQHQPFCLEVCNAHPVVIPMKSDAPERPGFSLWVSPKRSRTGALVLFQDFPRNDLGRFDGMGLSHLSALAYLVVEVSQELAQTSLMPKAVDDYIQDCRRRCEHFFFWPESPNLFLSALDGSIYFGDLAKRAPLTLLARLGCKVGMPRVIQCLYRTRFVSDAGLGVFGYPIFIAEHCK